ncbi:DUF2479 domain-containing protein [Weissella paramesenteroides]|uniref:phage baseplate upper protein n=1 Tax=Weissella paramesenteroides TaxID=1249 RepID=UPI00223C5245|nr:phage baseplate upper protein [Weissella paramesenteroides]MCS9983693.1 DUF2479 domain-containing protein [Weissella paramesenteroides]MCS9997944.1 DUF2479 domain-containing protein [Weissella paramesenteroides]MCT0260162.1 DUF2479 domain-containing protein [Weissella paramesenteroides]
MTLQATMQGRYAVVNTLLNITDVTLIESLNGRQGDNGRIVYFAIKDGSLPHNLTNQDVKVVAKDSQGKIKVISGIKDLISAQAGLFSMLMPAEIYQSSGDMEEAYLQIVDDTNTVISSVPITFTVVANNILMTANASDDYIDSIQKAVDKANEIINGLSNNIQAQSVAYNALSSALESISEQVNSKQVALKNVSNTFTADNIYSGKETYNGPVIVNDQFSSATPLNASLATLIPTFSSFSDVVKNISKYVGTYGVSSSTVTDMPFQGIGIAKIINYQGSNLSGIIELTSTDSNNVMYVGHVSSNVLNWTKMKVASDGKAATLLLFSQMYIDLYETESGVQATLRGWFTSDTKWTWTDTGVTLPANITKPKLNTFIEVPFQSGVEGTSSRIPGILSIGIYVDGSIKFKVQNYDNNNWNIYNYTSNADGSAYWIK